jgi:hypothetical protein
MHSQDTNKPNNNLEADGCPLDSRAQLTENVNQLKVEQENLVSEENQPIDTTNHPRLNQVCNFLEQNQRVHTESAYLSPLGLGLIKLRSVAQHEQLVSYSPFQFGINHTIKVVVMQGLEGNSSDSSDTNSAIAKEQARFNALQSHCANTSLFHRKDVPGGSNTSLFSIKMKPTLIDATRIGRSIATNKVSEVPRSTGQELVRSRPSPAVILLQTFPAVDAAVRKLRNKDKGPILIISYDGIVHDNVEATACAAATMQQTAATSTLNHPTPPQEIQMEDVRPGPTTDDGPAQVDGVGQKRKDMALPTLISSTDPRIPLTQSVVRRSSRFSSHKEGYCQARIVKEPSKRSKNWVIEVDEQTGEIRPLSIATLQAWGIKCGVDPSDLTEDILLQEPGAQIVDHDDEE